MLNLIDHHVPKQIQTKYGFYILHRVQHHVLYDEPWDEGWGKATDALRALWAKFDVVDRERMQRVA